MILVTGASGFLGTAVWLARLVTGSGPAMAVAAIGR
jgi:uncharacterized protein YbjT (DUF2867 family)